jgi:hypothetical protein
LIDYIIVHKYYATRPNAYYAILFFQDRLVSYSIGNRLFSPVVPSEIVFGILLLLGIIIGYRILGIGGMVTVFVTGLSLMVLIKQRFKNSLTFRGRMTKIASELMLDSILYDTTKIKTIMLKDISKVEIIFPKFWEKLNQDKISTLRFTIKGGEIIEYAHSSGQKFDEIIFNEDISAKAGRLFKKYLPAVTYLINDKSVEKLDG